MHRSASVCIKSASSLHRSASVRLHRQVGDACASPHQVCIGVNHTASRSSRKRSFAAVSPNLDADRCRLDADRCMPMQITRSMQTRCRPMQNSMQMSMQMSMRAMRGDEKSLYKACRYAHDATKNNVKNFQKKNRSMRHRCVTK